MQPKLVMDIKLMKKMEKTVKFSRNSVSNHYKVSHFEYFILICQFKTFKTALYAVCICLRYSGHLRICSIEVCNPFNSISSTMHSLLLSRRTPIYVLCLQHFKK